MDKRKNLTYIIVIVLTAIVLRLPTFLYSYVNIDETDYTLAARIILDGGLPYKDFLIYQPPLIYYIYALGFWLAGGVSLTAVHAITIAFVCGTCLSLYFLVGKITLSRQSALVAGLAYAFYSTLFLPMDMLAANCEIMMMFPLTLAVLFFYMADKKGTFPFYLLTGLMIGMGVMTKYQGGIVLVGVVIYILLRGVLNQAYPRHQSGVQDDNENCHSGEVCHSGLACPPTFDKYNGWRDPKSSSQQLSKGPRIRSGVTKLAALTLGFLLPLAAFALYLYHKGAIRGAYEAFTYILVYAKGPVQSDLLYTIMKFFARSIIFSLTSLPIWIGAFVVIRRSSPFCKGELGGVETSLPSPTLSYKGREPFTIFLILWFFLSIIPVIMGGRMYFHYYIIILPPACALFGVWWAGFCHCERLSENVIPAPRPPCEQGEAGGKAGIQKPLKPLDSRLRGDDTLSPPLRPTPYTVRRTPYAMLIWLVICTVGWEAYAVYTPLTPPKAKETWVNTANYLKEIAKPGETMFVWGCAYQLYFVSGLMPANRFTSADYLTGRSPMTAGLEYNPEKETPTSFEKLLRDFTEEPYQASSPEPHNLSHPGGAEGYAARGVAIFDTSANIFPPAWDYFKHDMESHLPTYIIDTSPSNYRRYGRYPIRNYPFLYNLIQKNYSLIKSIDGYDVYGHNP